MKAIRMYAERKAGKEWVCDKYVCTNEKKPSMNVWRVC